MTTKICNPEKNLSASPWARTNNNNNNNASARRYALPNFKLKIDSAKRCLFGSVDHVANQRWLKKVCGEHQAVDSSKWNFDFITGRPLNGNYAWEPTGLPSRPLKRKSPPATAPLLDENSSCYFQPIEPVDVVVDQFDKKILMGAAVPKRAVKTFSKSDGDQQKAKKQQSLITDFMMEKKRLFVVGKETSSERPSKIPKLNDCSS